MTTITIERDLLEQALEALDNSVDVVYEEYTDAVQRYANIPGRKARLDGLAAMAKAHLDTSDAIRATLAAPATVPEKCGHCGRRTIDPPWPIKPATDDRHAQELLAMEITLQNMAERHAQELCAYELTVQNLRDERDAAMKDAERMKEGLDAVEVLIDQSSGVAGLHLNGDLASWRELRTGGRFETWLLAFDEAINGAMKGTP